MIVESERDRPALKENINPELANQRHFRLPKLELPSFNGEVKQWLTFWSQFKKIHGDPMIDNDDKPQYLTQCMEVGSKARDMVESFPPCGSKYEVVVDQLKQRFARDELVIEHYVRELLQLTLSQAKGVSGWPIASLHDKITTQVLALESMGRTQNKYAAFLYPLVEAALPGEALRSWHRSCTDGSCSGGYSLNDLLLFVKREVFADERVRLARTFTMNSVAGTSTSCFTTADEKQKPQQTPAKVCIF
ncbi:uncharacterized protein LOC121731965 [Aricia agestis]|uniref:uncharacterized protein LOC121731965 n=1 Tax=Aricia agestis TaxID=91739 RepID=UPI001C204CDE|nr:uncharacterized protein LOC121731965 [Aricia agestis]